MAKNWEEICSMQKGIKMNNWAWTLTLLDVWMNLPHPCIMIRWSANSWEPFNKSTWVLFPIVWKGEKQLDACNIHPMHPRFVFILNYESTIMAWSFALPMWTGLDLFSVHPTKATLITWSIKGGNGRVKDRDLTLNYWAVFKVNIIRCDLNIFVDLVKDKMMGKWG